MNSVTVSKRQIMALLKTAAKSDVRYYLNGVFVDFDDGVMVSTDGHFMLVFRPETMSGKGTFIIPRDLLESIIKVVGNGRISYDANIEIICDSKRINISASGAEMSGETIDGKFPAYDRVVPLTFSGAPSQIQTHLYTAAGEALKFCAGDSVGRKEYPVIAHNGPKGKSKSNGAAVMYLHGYMRAFVVIMPFRPTVETNDGVIEFAKNTIHEVMGSAS